MTSPGWIISCQNDTEYVRNAYGDIMMFTHSDDAKYWAKEYEGKLVPLIRYDRRTSR